MKKSRLWKKKGYRYGVVRFLSLVMAAVLFLPYALEVVEATSVAPELGGAGGAGTDTGTVTEISTAEAFLELRKRDDAGSYKLTQDIEIAIEDVATKTFSGTFDGNGHVIKITPSGTLTDSTAGTVSQGLLFGTVTGTVRNLIVDITGEVTYQRTSTVAAPTSSSTVSTETYEDISGITATATNNSDTPFVSRGNETLTKELERNGETVILEGESEKTYVREAEKQSVEATRIYQLEEPGEDGFGVICGQLTGSVEKVYVTGSDVKVVQASGEISAVYTEDGTKEKYLYYEKTKGDYVDDSSITNLRGNVDSQFYIYKNTGLTQSGEDGNLAVTVTGDAYKSIDNNNITYKITVKNTNEDKVLNNIHLAPLVEMIDNTSNVVETLDQGDWDDSYKDGFELAKGESRTFFYTVSVSGNDFSQTKFRMNYTCDLYTSVDVSTGEVTSSIGEMRTVTDSDAGEENVTVKITYPNQAVQYGEIVYTMNVELKKDCKNVILEKSNDPNDKSGVWYDESETKISSDTQHTKAEIGDLTAGSYTYYYKMIAQNTTILENINFRFLYEDTDDSYSRWVSVEPDEIQTTEEVQVNSGMASGNDNISYRIEYAASVPKNGSWGCKVNLQNSNNVDQSPVTLAVDGMSGKWYRQEEDGDKFIEHDPSAPYDICNISSVFYFVSDPVAAEVDNSKIVTFKVLQDDCTGIETQVTLSITDPAGKSTVENTDEYPEAVKVSVNYPSKIEKEKSLIYEVKVENTSDTDITGFKLSDESGSGGVWYSEREGVTKVFNNSNASVTLKAMESVFYYYIIPGTAVTETPIECKIKGDYKDAENRDRCILAITEQVSVIDPASSGNNDTDDVFGKVKITASVEPVTIPQTSEDMIYYKVVVENLQNPSFSDSENNILKKDLQNVELFTTLNGTWYTRENDVYTEIHSPSMNLAAGESKVWYYGVPVDEDSEKKTGFTAKWNQCVTWKKQNILDSPLYTEWIDTNTAATVNEKEIISNNAGDTGNLQLKLSPLGIDGAGKTAYIMEPDSTLRLSYELTLTNNFLPDNKWDGKNVDDVCMDITKVQFGLNGDSSDERFDTLLYYENSGKLTVDREISYNVLSDGSTLNTMTAEIEASAKNVYKDVDFYRYAGTGEELNTQYQTDQFVRYSDEAFKPSESSGNEAVVSSRATRCGHNLNVGGITGISSGTITECKQSAVVSGSVDNGAAPVNDAELRLGGIAGSASASSNMSYVYLEKMTDYKGHGDVVPTNCANQGASKKPAGDQWSDYGKYTLNDGQMNKASLFDLSWLVKQEQNLGEQFTYTDKGSSKFDVSINNEVRKLTDYAVIYNARRSLSPLQSETDLYQASFQEQMDLGESGYYRVVAAYATDGYYHYCTDVKTLDQATMVYPYLTVSYPKVNDLTWTTPKDENAKEDVIVVSGFPHDGRLYYIPCKTEDEIVIPTSTNSTSVDIQSGKAELKFDSNDVSYCIVPVMGEHIYPAMTSEFFGAEDRKTLDRPDVIYQSGYDKDDKEEYAAFSPGISMKSGQKLKISVLENTNLQYRLFNTKELAGDKWAKDEWGNDKWKEDQYTGDKVNELSGMQNYIDGITVSGTGTEEETYWLCVKVSKTNYQDVIYRYGPFTVEDAIKMTPIIYYTEQNVSDIQSGGTIVDGDLLKLQCDAGYDIQYAISYEQKTSGFEWIPYKGNFIPLEQDAHNMVYVYVAALQTDAQGQKKIKSIQEFEYTFAESCLPVLTTPNTGQETDDGTGAASVESGSTVKLSTRTSDGRILYVEPVNSMDFIFERVTDVPEGIQDGAAEGSYKYYQVGSRWYRTTLTDMKVYSSSTEIKFNNVEAKQMRIYAIVLKDGYKPSAERKYIYSVAAQQQVTVPEASLKTRKAEDADNVAATKVELGSSLLFSCMTPGVTLYYRLPGESVWTEIPVSGVVVNGKYDARYTISVKAEKEGMLDSAVVTYEYVIASQEAVMAPTAIPTTATDAPAVVMPGSKILLSSLTKGAMIYYTLDGSSPRLTENEDGSYQAAEGTMLYESEKGIVVPEGHSGLFTVCAVAVRSGLAKSEEVHLVYTFPDAVVTPYANVSQGYVALDTEVHLMNKTEDAVIYYTVAYGDEVPEEPTLSSAIYDDTYPFVITKKTTIRAFAAKGGVKSSILELTYLPMEELSVPVPSIESGSIVSRGTVLTLKAADGATVYYTMDGSDPLDSANKAVVSGTTIALNGEAGSQITIKAYAAADDKSASEVVTFTYQFSQSAGGVTADVESGSLVSNGTKVNLMTDVSGAEIHYTTDGSSPAESGIKGTTVTINGVPGTSFTIKAVAVIDGEAGVVAAFTYKIKEVPNAPTAAPAGGTLTVAARVTLSSGSEKIYYTTDGTTPTESSSLYSEPILINRTTTLKAIAVSQDGEISEAASWQYVAAAKAEAPAANLADMSVLEPGTIVLLRTNTPDAEIYYSTDGTVPSLTNLDDMLLYQEDGITISRSVTIKAVSYREDLQLSNVGVWNYVVEKIPAVEIRVQKEAKLAEEELRDTDSSGLDRDKAVEGTTYKSRVLEDGSCGTVVSSDWESIAPQTKLAAEQVEISSATVNNVRKMFGEDHTVLVSYDMKLMNGSTYVKPNGDVEIGIPIPEGYENAVLTIASVDSEHRLKVCETRRSGDMLYASTDQMNQFVVIGVEELESEDTSSIYILDWFMAIYEKISAKW